MIFYWNYKKMSKCVAEKKIEEIKQKKNFFAFHLDGIDISIGEECFVLFTEFTVDFYSIEDNTLLLSLPQENISLVNVYHDKEKIMFLPARFISLRTIFSYLVLKEMGLLLEAIFLMFPKIKKQDYYIVEFITKERTILMKIEE